MVERMEIMRKHVFPRLAQGDSVGVRLMDNCVHNFAPTLIVYLSTCACLGSHKVMWTKEALQALLSVYALQPGVSKAVDMAARVNASVCSDASLESPGPDGHAAVGPEILESLLGHCAVELQSNVFPLDPPAGCILSMTVMDDGTGMVDVVEVARRSREVGVSEWRYVCEAVYSYTYHSWQAGDPVLTQTGLSVPSALSGQVEVALQAASSLASEVVPSRNLTPKDTCWHCHWPGHFSDGLSGGLAAVRFVGSLVCASQPCLDVRAPTAPSRRLRS